MNKKYICTTLILILLIMNTKAMRTYAAEDDIEKLNLQSEAVVLMEASSGAVIISRNQDKELRPASITKIMTLILIFDEIKKGNISYTDEVSISEHAASMGGSQIFLEPNEIQCVEDLIKSITIASANDASVAMAEYIAGSEELFVDKMNEKAALLGMKHTNFVNCYGLDTDNHYSSAYDVALMSRELINTHPEITLYSTTWMDTIIHKTAKGESEFGLSNTNKLIKTYKGITGLKTGSTGLAKYCLSATAERDGITLISVIMAAPDTKTRFKEAAELLNYGFANCSIYTENADNIVLDKINVIRGQSEYLNIKVEDDFTFVHDNSVSNDRITYEIALPENVEAPISDNQVIGKVIFSLDNDKIGEVNIIASETIEKSTFKSSFIRSMNCFFNF